MISIIIPVYNVEQFLPRCIDSILNQDYQDIEVILVNDGSTDHSGLICDDYAADDARIRVIEQTNQGQAAARNRAMEIATGEWLVFVDSDDYLDDGYLTFMLNHIGDADLLQTGYRRVDLHGNILEAKCPTKARPYIFISPWARIYRRSFLTKNKLHFTEGMIYEDVLFSAQLWKCQPHIRVEEYYGYNYLTNPYSTTSKPHDTSIIRRKLREEKLSLWQFNQLRLRLVAHFLKERISYWRHYFDR